MSCVTLARKTRATAPRFRRDKCFVLNMTGRGGLIGSKPSSQCKTKDGSHVSRCCEANHLANDCKKTQNEKQKVNKLRVSVSLPSFCIHQPSKKNTADQPANKTNQQENILKEEK